MRPARPLAPLAVLAVFAVFAVLPVLPACKAAAQPIAGRYQARPAPVLACGGFAGACRVLQLEGTLDLEVAGPPVPGAPAEVRIVGSDLRLTPLAGGESMPFPGSPPDLQLTSLVEVDGAAAVTLRSPEGSAQTAELELWPADAPTNGSFLLRGFYDEGCCDRFRHELGGVLFDWTGPEGQALWLEEAGFAVTAAWQDGRGGSGAGTPIAFDGRSGRFWFFQPDNPELLVKLIDACVPFGRWWFFAAGLTDVGVELRVTHLAQPGERVYERPAGQPFTPILDTDAFPCAVP